MDQATKQQTVESIVNTKDFGKLVQSAWSFMMEEVGMADLADVTASDDFMDQVNDEVNDLVARKHKGLSDSDHAKVVSAALKRCHTAGHC